MSSPAKRWFAVALGATVLCVGVTFLAGFLLGHYTGGTSTTVAEGGGRSEAGGAAEGEPGAQVFAESGCGDCHTFTAAGSTGNVGPNLNEYLAPDDTAAGVEEMIVDPEAEIAEGFTAGVMPQDYGRKLSEEEMGELVRFLVANSPAGGG